MKKLLIVFDAKHFSEAAVNFAMEIANESAVSVTGLFLRQSDFVPVWDPGPLPGIGFLPYEREKDPVQETITNFEETCVRNRLPYHIHQSPEVTNLPELMKISRFYDGIIVSNEFFFKNVNKEQPNVYLKDLLHAAECPVIVVPEAAKYPDTIVLAYDGSKSSVYAIRQFALLFPELCDKKVLLVFEGDPSSEIPVSDNIRAFCAAHFSNFGFINIDARRKDAFRKWLGKFEQPMVVCGSYGRATWQESLSKSFATGIIRDHKAILFVAHQ
jgi:hypothetical protein